MSDNFQTSFSIIDLEILSGIKAHTLRIWEKRYNFLNPQRHSRNIRTYSIHDLRKVLNTAFLQERGFKISQIAALSDKQISDATKEYSMDDMCSSMDINTLIISMFTLDEKLFNSVYNRQIKYRPFEDIYISVFTPVLQRIGMLWQVDSIKPGHEHFISTLIYQKICQEIDKLGINDKSEGPVHILFLPEGEIHELGLMFLNYVLRSKGLKTINLGQSIPIDDLFEINTQFTDVHWISNIVLSQHPDKIQKLLNRIDQLLAHTDNQCSIIGHFAENAEDYNYGPGTELFSNFEKFVNNKVG